MQFLPIVITIVLGALALAYVLYPFYRRTSAPPAQAGETVRAANQRSVDARPHAEQAFVPGIALPDQVTREQIARSALREIELDYQLGNITEADYSSLRERYVRRALVALKSRYDREQELNEAIEVQLRQLREKNDDAN